jgi:hypothetical protein
VQDARFEWREIGSAEEGYRVWVKMDAVRRGWVGVCNVCVGEGLKQVVAMAGVEYMSRIWIDPVVGDCNFLTAVADVQGQVGVVFEDWGCFMGC